MVDRVETARRRQSPRKPSTKHPYAAIEHRVIDSDAFGDLGGSAVKVLLLLARQLTKTNNGHLQATFSYMNKHGISSEHTLKKAVDELIAHGLIYRTRSHGANKAWARYAVTWLPITDKDDLFLSGFQPNAWRDWRPSEKKAPRKKCGIDPAETAVSPAEFLQKLQDDGGQKVQTMNLVPHVGAVRCIESPPRFAVSSRERGEGAALSAVLASMCLAEMTG